MWGASKFSVCGWNPKAWPFKWKLLNNAFLSRCFIMDQLVRILASVDEIQKCDHSNESYWTVLSCSTVYYNGQGGSNLWVFMKWFSLMSQPCRWNPEMCDHSNRSSWAVHACGTVLFLFLFIFCLFVTGRVVLTFVLSCLLLAYLVPNWDVLDNVSSVTSYTKITF